MRVNPHCIKTGQHRHGIQMRRRVPAHPVEFELHVAWTHSVQAARAESCCTTGVVKIEDALRRYVGIARGPAVTQTDLGAVMNVVLDRLEVNCRIPKSGVESITFLPFLLRIGYGREPEQPNGYPDTFALKTGALWRLCSDGFSEIEPKSGTFTPIGPKPTFSPGPTRTRHSGAFIDVK